MCQLLCSTGSLLRLPISLSQTIPVRGECVWGESEEKTVKHLFQVHHRTLGEQTSRQIVRFVKCSLWKLKHIYKLRKKGDKETTMTRVGLLSRIEIKLIRGGKLLENDND